MNLLDVLRQQQYDITHLVFELVAHHLSHPGMTDAIISALNRTFLQFIATDGDHIYQDVLTNKQIKLYLTFLHLLDYNRVLVFDEVKNVGDNLKTNEGDNLIQFYDDVFKYFRSTRLKDIKLTFTQLKGELEKLRQITYNRQELNLFITGQRFDVARAVDLILDKIDNLSLEQEYNCLKEIERHIYSTESGQEYGYLLSYAYLNIQMAIVLMQKVAGTRPDFFQFFVEQLRPIIQARRS